MDLPVTLAKLIKITSKSPTKLPREFLELLKLNSDEHAILVFAVSTQTIRLIPTKSDQVVKIVIEIGDLTPGFLDRLGRVLASYKVDTLYSSGICFTEESCIYEGYIDRSELTPTSLDQLESKLSEIDGISSVNLSILTVE
ncbi:MAG: hypothetical protein ACE5I5_00360 [Candidatus Heimdallarchaeota archaeon]